MIGELASRRAFGGTLLVLLAGVHAIPAQGQGYRDPTVTERPRPEYDALGMRRGSFVIYPSLGVEARYDDNIYALPAATVDDVVFELTPELRIESDWNNHSLKVYGRGAIGRYVDQGSEDYEDFDIGIEGRRDISRDTYAFGHLSWTKLHEDRGSPDDARGVNPTEYYVLLPTATISHRFGRFSVEGKGELRRLEYDNVVRADGTSVNNGLRDRNEWEGALRLGYEVAERYQAFVRGAYLPRDYDNRQDINGFDRNSTGFEVVGGLAIEYSALLWGDIFGGYREQDLDDPRLPTIDGPVIGGNLTWNPTRRTTVTGHLSRTIEETTLAGASGYFATSVRGGVDFEVRYNFLVGLHIGYINKDYEGISREDDEVRLRLNADYLVNRYLKVSGGYEFRTRDSDALLADYDRNTVFLRATGRF